mgnify:CR=1 FL=1
MSKGIQVSLVSNAGVLVEINETKMLIDALWEHSEAYSSPPEEIHEQMLYGTAGSKWRNADYLLFTHLHKDHFEQDVVIEYLQYNNVRSVYFDSRPAVAESDKLEQYLAERELVHGRFGLQCDSYKHWQLNEQLAVTAICTPHMGIHAHQDHVAIVLHGGGKHLLFVADAEFPLPIFKQALGGIRPDAVFLNPVHFYSKRALRFVVEELQVKKIVAYHIPFAGEGNSVFRRMISKKLDSVGTIIPVDILWNIGDCLEI